MTGRLGATGRVFVLVGVLDCGKNTTGGRVAEAWGVVGNLLADGLEIAGRVGFVVDGFDGDGCRMELVEGLVRAGKVTRAGCGMLMTLEGAR